MLNIPGSKSISQRMLIINFLAKEKCKLENLSDCDDVFCLKKALNDLKKDKDDYYFGDNATGLRFFLAICMGLNKKVSISGSKQLKNRPHKQLIKALKQAKSGKVSITGQISSQFISALLFYFVAAKKNGEINILGDLVSKPYLDLTIKLLTKFRVKVENAGYKKIIIKGSNKLILPNKFTIEPDASLVTPYLVWSLLTKKKLNLPDFTNSTQEDKNLINIIKNQNNKKIIIDLNLYPDAALPLIVINNFIGKKFKFINGKHLKYKESDRLKKIKKNLKKIKEGNFIVDPENDHRIAMCFAILKEKFPELKIMNKECVNKSFPDFFNELEKISGLSFDDDIILIGNRGSGKTFLGKKLANELKLPFYDLDEEIEKNTQALSKLKDGKLTWTKFRKIESEMLEKTLNNHRIVLATGGGTIESIKNRKLMKSLGFVIFLNIKLSIIKKRLAIRKNPPQYINSIEVDYKKRLKLYKSIADVRLNPVDANAKSNVSPRRLFRISTSA